MNLNISCQTTVQNFLTVPEINVQVSFRGRTLRFWSLKSPITYCMTLSTVRLAQDCSDEHFLFFNLSQNIHSLKDILLILWTLLGLLYNRPCRPFGLIYQKKGPVILYISRSTTVQKFLTVLEISVQVSCRSRTCNSLKGPHMNIMKGVYCSELYSYEGTFVLDCSTKYL